MPADTGYQTEHIFIPAVTATYLTERDTFGQLCHDYHVSRKTGYDWTAVEHRNNQKEFRTAD